MPDPQAHASSYANRRRTDSQDGRSNLAASTRSSVHTDRFAPCEVDRHGYGQRSNATKSVRCPTERPRRATRSGTLRMNVRRTADQFCCANESVALVTACGDWAPCGDGYICKACHESRKPSPQRAHKREQGGVVQFYSYSSSSTSAAISSCSFSGVFLTLSSWSDN